MLKSGSELRPATPPDDAATKKELAELQALAAKRDAKALDQIAYWDAGSPSYRWQTIALDQMRNGPPNAGVSRMMALLNVALYDAMVAAWDAKYAYNRPRPSELDPKLITALPNPASPSYPSEQAVAAVAAKVIDVAKADGSNAKWTGSVPKGPGLWSGDNPAGATVGTWKTWVLKDGSQFRMPPPPAYDSDQKKAELQEIKTLTRTFPITERALYWHTFDGAYDDWYAWASKHIFENKLDDNPPRAARVYALLSTAAQDAIIACFDTKYAYWAAQPNMLDPTIVTLFPTPPHPSYPSAHGCNTSAMAATLAYLFPSDAKSVEALSDEAAMSRMWSGIHFRSDDDAGLELGRRVASSVVQRAQNDGAVSTMPFPTGHSVGRQFSWGYALISFKPDGKLDVSVDGKVEVKDATYKVTEDKLVLGGDPQTCGGTDQADGAYQWAFDGKTFTFNAVADKCDTRRLVNTNGPWFLQQ